MLLLRDMIKDDIEDYVRWFTIDTEWGLWDAPWESHFSSNEDEERKAWTDYYNSVKDIDEKTLRWKFEIVVDGKHIGWVCSYYDLDYLENKEKIIAIGIDIPDLDSRGHGYGTIAIKKYIEYLNKHGHHSFYIQTWSGNISMLRVIEKLQFKEIFRKKNYREVRGMKYDAITFKLDL